MRTGPAQVVPRGVQVGDQVTDAAVTAVAKVVAVAVGASEVPDAAAQTKSLTLAPSNPNSEMMLTSMTLQRVVRFVPPA